MTKTYIFANSVDLDETAHNKPSHQDLHCLPFDSGFFNDTPTHTTTPTNPRVQQLICPKSKTEEPTSETQGWQD